MNKILIDVLSSKDINAWRVNDRARKCHRHRGIGKQSPIVYRRSLAARKNASIRGILSDRRATCACRRGSRPRVSEVERVEKLRETRGRRL